MRPKKILSVVFVTLLLCCAVSANEDCDIPNDVNTLIHDFVIQFPNDYKMVAWRPWANTSLENCSEENPLNMAIVTLKSTLNQLHKDSRALSKGRLLNDMLIACEASEILQESNSDGHGPILANRTDCLCRTEVNAARLGDILREVVHGKRDHKCPAAPTAITDAITTASSTVESTTADAISTPVVSDDDKNDTGRLEGSVDSSPNSDWWMIAALVFMTTTVVLLSLLVCKKRRHRLASRQQSTANHYLFDVHHPSTSTHHSSSLIHRSLSSDRSSRQPAELEILMGPPSAEGMETDNQSDTDTIGSLV